MNEPLVSAVIVTWNRLAEVRVALQSLVAQDYPHLEILVVDNASTDGTPEMIAGEFPQVRVLRQDHNLGCPGGRNVGVRAATGEFIFSLDDDAEAEPAVVSTLLRHFQRDPQLAVLMPRLVDCDPAASRPELPPVPPLRYRGLYTGGAALIRKAVIEAVGYFPADYIWGVGETDFALRVLDAGYRLLVDNSVVIWHYRTPTMRDECRAFAFGYRNNIRCLWRRAPLSRALVGTVHNYLFFGRFALGRGYLPTHLRVSLTLPAEILRNLGAHRRPVGHDAYALLYYLEDHWVSAWDELDMDEVRRYGGTWRREWRKLRGLRRGAPQGP